jgi:nitrite reductase (NADH) large subunit
MEREKLVVIGAGIAGLASIEEVLKLDPERYEITMFGREPHVNYNRVLLAHVLRGEKEIKDLYLHDASWYEARGVRVVTGVKATEIRRKSRAVAFDDGSRASYSRLVLATGSRPNMPRIDGIDKDGVLAFRDAADCERIKRLVAGGARKAIVIGGGLLGLEAAYSLTALGLDVTIAHLADRLMERQLDGHAGRLLREDVERLGIKVLLGKETSAVLGGQRMEGLLFKDGSTVEADLAVVSIGVAPNDALARTSGIYCEKGVVVSDIMQTFDPAVYAVGECIQHRGVTFGLVSSVLEQARVLADHLAGSARLAFRQKPSSVRLKIPDVDLYSAGRIDDACADTIEYADKSERTYKRLFIKEGRLEGMVLYGDTSLGPKLFSSLIDNEDVSAKRSGLLAVGGWVGGGAAPAGVAGAGELPESAVVCGCNGVSKGDIVRAIREKGLFTRDDVKRETKAASSCGGCAAIVDGLLEETLGVDFQGQGEPERLCACTIYSREDILRNIREKGLRSVDDVMEAMGWLTVGCDTCRPAINYYTSMVWPDCHADDPTSRLINERAHANIQKDNTFSVIPRTYGGVISPDELKRIADAAIKYRVSLVKITGGQRIGLFGLRKEDLPSAWRDIGLPSGYAYGKALRTVKSCVGSLYCRYGTQDSLGLAVLLEKKLEGLWMPAKVKMGASGCPRNCAESLIKDVGVTGIAGAWRIYAGGCGGIELRKGELLAEAKTENDVVEIVSAFLQLYREEAEYGERTFKWLERRGLSAIRKAVVDDEVFRKTLAMRLDSALSQTKDPWKSAAGA